MAWTCPDCSRRFARTRQGHECAPAMTLADYFSTGPDHERPIVEALIAHFESVGEVWIEPLAVGVFFKRSQRFCDARPMTKWMAVSFGLPRRASHPTIKRAVNEYHGTFHHTANVADVVDLDEPLLGLLTEAYFACPD